jgi:hypothetical protein
MNPMRERRGLCLASPATQTPEGAALASTTDTSRQHDNLPVLTQRAESEAFLTARSFTRRVLVSEPDEAQAGVCEPSLPAERMFCRWLQPSSTGCLSTPRV